jgi:RND family efflux transporter MFP subunit
MTTGSVEIGSGPGGATAARSAPLRWLGLLFRVLLLLAVLAAGGGVSFYWLTRTPKAHRRPPQPQATLVEVRPVSPRTHTVVVRPLGTVIPARTIQLASQVSGRIVHVSPELIPGGRFSAGEKILQIEPKDYELAVRQRASDLAKERSALKVEMGQQSVARRECELLGEEIKPEDEELVLRKPQLATAQAAVEAADAVLQQAQLDLKRTDVLAPFNAMIRSRTVDLGSQVSVGTALASLVGTDKYWVQVSIPVDELRWVDVPGPGRTDGSPARVYCEPAWGPDAFRAGTVERLMAELEPQGKMARLLVAVQDPLELSSDTGQRYPLILGSYVRVEIRGRDLPNVVRVPRTALRDGRCVWVMRPDRTLDIRQVKTVWSGNEHVYVTDGLSEGDLLITSDLGAPVQGMALRSAETAARREGGRPAGTAEAAPKPEGE